VESDLFSIGTSPLARRRPLYYRDEFSGSGGNWVDGPALHLTA
jgi:hypothetical protein